MCKKLSSLLLLLLCGSCSNLPIFGENHTAENQTIAASSDLKKMVMRSQTVEIYNDWNGYSDITPILRHYKLNLQRQELIGNAHIAIGGYGAAGIEQQQTTKVKIPATVTAKFLETLSKTPLQVGKYQPKIDRHDDYPSIEIKIKIDRQLVIFSSQSQAKNRIPWQVKISKKNTTKAYISNSAYPDRAFQLLRPYLDRPGIDQIIERRRQRKINK
jgi:hypothetical protein